MDDSLYHSILLLTALLFLHALVVFAANVLTHSRHSVLHNRAEEGDRKAILTLSILAQPIRIAITTHFSLALLKFALAAATAAYIVPAYTALDAEVHLPISLIGAVLLLTLIGYVVGDLIPSTLGRSQPERFINWMTPVMKTLEVIFAPFLWLFIRIEALIARWSGGEEISKAIIEDEIINLVESSEREGVLEDDERNMIRSVLEFDETMVREIMVPRVDITAVEVDKPLREALRIVIESGHSRIPVYNNEIDKISGLLYAKDLLEAWYNGDFERKTIADVMRPAVFVPETKRAEDLFREFQRSNTQLAIVVDEFGSTAGVISVEDIVEEIVGDIRDEYDITETIEYTELGPNEYSVDASINLYDFNEQFDTDLPTDESDSLGGYLYQHFGRVPEIGEELQTNDLVLRIRSVEGVRIREIHVIRVIPPLANAKTQDPPTEPPPYLEPRANNL